MHLHRVVVDQQEIIAKEDLDQQGQQDLQEIKDLPHQKVTKDLKE